MATEPLTQVADWRSAVAAASACAILGLLIRAAAFAGAALPPPAAMIGLGAGLVGASLLLSWAADAAEVELSGPLVLAGVVFVTVLPELVIEIHFAYTQQTELVSANLTGATRLLLTAAVAMPVLGAWLLARRGQHAAAASYRLSPARRVDLAILFLASLYGILLALLGRVSLIDGLLLIGLYLFFLRRIGGTPDEPPAVVGVSASLAALPPQQRRRLLVGLFSLAAVVVTVVAVPFSDALQQTGTSVGISSYLLVQSIVPAATETPEFVVAMTLALNRRPGQGLAVFLTASVVQWTLALGVLPWAYLAGGGPSALPLDTRATVEVALTVSTTLMAIAALASLAPQRIDSGIVLTLFAIQFAFPATGVRIVVAVVLALFALDILVANHREVRPMFASLRSRHPPPAESRRERRKRERQERRAARTEERERARQERRAKRDARKGKHARNATVPPSEESKPSQIVGGEPEEQALARPEALARLDPVEERGPARAATGEEERARVEADRWIREARVRLGEAEEGREPAEAEAEAEERVREAAETARRLEAEALERAARQLEETEARASESESRAARAERLEKLKADETEHERRLQEMLDRIEKAEQRASEAEQRAREAANRSAEPQQREPEPEPARPQPEPAPAEPEPGLQPGPPEAAVPAPSSAPDPTIVAGVVILIQGVPEGKLNLNEATYEDLRRLKLSIKRTGRVLDYRQSLGGFKSLDQLDDIAGIPRDVLTELKRKLTI